MICFLHSISCFRSIFLLVSELSGGAEKLLQFVDLAIASQSSRSETKDLDSTDSNPNLQEMESLLESNMATVPTVNVTETNLAMSEFWFRNVSLYMSSLSETEKELTSEIVGTLDNRIWKYLRGMYFKTQKY